MLSRNKNLYYAEWILPRNNKMHKDYDKIVVSVIEGSRNKEVM